MIWVAYEYVDTHEVTGFWEVPASDLQDILDDYKVSRFDVEPFHVKMVEEEEAEKMITYEGVIYHGGYICDIWVATKKSERND